METLGLFLLAALIVGASKGGLASAAALAISGSTMAPPRWVILPQALITRRNWYFS